jgi:O-Antigen ligase
MWKQLVTFLLIGYLCMGRSFAYWGIPQWYLFIGEGALFLFLFFGPCVNSERWVWLAMRQPSLHRFKKAYVVFFVFGIFEVIRGVISGNPLLFALRDLSMHYYPLYFFMGMWVALNDEQYLPNFFRLVAWVNGIYGTLFILLLSRVGWSFSGFSDNTQSVQIFGQPSYSALILLGLLAFEKDLRRIWPLLALNSIVLLGMLIRAEWLAFGMGLLVWAWASRNFKRVAWGGALVLVLLFLMYITNFSVKGPETRGGTISATDMLGRVLAPINADAASDYTPDTHMYEGNVVWRTMFWLQIWDTVHETKMRALLGYGYGYPINELVPYLEEEATRTPHNVFFLVLGYTGWIGVAIFAAFQLELLRLFRAVHQETGEPFGMVFFVAMIAFALFTPFFETPQGAIPFYLLAGCICASLFQAPAEIQVEVRPLVPANQEGI